MTRIENEVEINAPIGTVYEYYTNPNNIQSAWPSDIVQESEATTETKNDKGSQMKVKGEYLGKRDEILLEVVEKLPNKKLVARQSQGPFRRLESIQEFDGDNNMTHVKHVIEYELPTTGKLVNFVTGSQADEKFRQGIQQAAQTVKERLERR